MIERIKSLVPDWRRITEDNLLRNSRRQPSDQSSEGPSKEDKTHPPDASSGDDVRLREERSSGVSILV